MLFERPNISFSPQRIDYLTPEDLLCTSSEDEPEESEMAALGIPYFLEKSYLAGTPPPVITKLRDWQVELFSMIEWQRGDNFLVLAPTAGGKTTAAEVAIAQMLQAHPDGKALYCLPFVSLANEKYFDFTKRFPTFSVRPFYGNVGQAELQHGSIAICTYEKCHSLLNAAMLSNTIDKIKLVVIDEIHMLGDQSRGAVIEALVAKLHLLRIPPRIVGLSATISPEDAALFAKFLGGHTYQSTIRPAPIHQSTIDTNGCLYNLINGQMIQSTISLPTLDCDKLHLLPLITNTLRQGESKTVLIFARTKEETRRFANLIAQNLYNPFFKLPKPSESEVKRRQAILDQMPDQSMKTCLLNGVAYHHAGLLLEERKVLEDGLRSGAIPVVVATTTLSAGINIPSVSLVVITSVFRWNGRNEIPISSAEYNQMAGRAGRASAGSVVVVQRRGSLDERDLIQKFSLQKLDAIKGHLLENDFDRFFLQCSVFFKGLQEALTTQSYEATKGSVDERKLRERVEKARETLSEKRLLSTDGKVTRLGEAIAHANFGVEEGLTAYQRLVKAQNLMSLSNEMNLLFICVPNEIGFTPPEFSDDAFWVPFLAKHSELIANVLKYTQTDFNRLVVLGRSQAPVIAADFDRLFAAALLQEVINEKELTDIETEYGISRGLIQALQTAAATFSGQLIKMCSRAGMTIIGAAIREFRQRLSYGVKDELLPLLDIPGCTRNMARFMYNQGYQTAGEVANAGIDDLVAITGESVETVLALKENAARLAEVSERLISMQEETEKLRLMQLY